MAAVKGKDTKPEIAIFINGCFWHQHENCKHAALPSTRREFWEAKLTANKQRDARNLTVLRTLGYTTLTIWECEIKSILATHTIPTLPQRKTSNAAAPAASEFRKPHFEI